MDGWVGGMWGLTSLEIGRSCGRVYRWGRVGWGSLLGAVGYDTVRRKNSGGKDW